MKKGVDPFVKVIPSKYFWTCFNFFNMAGNGLIWNKHLSWVKNEENGEWEMNGYRQKI